MARPLRHRPVDLLFIVFFSIAVLYGLLFSLPEALGVPVTSDSPWPPLRALHSWAIAQEPAHLDPPPSLIASCLFDGFIQAPILLVILFGLVRQSMWLRPWTLFYSGAAVINMFYYLFQTFAGPHPPPHTGLYLAYNLPWLIAPVALVIHVHTRRFAR